MARGHAFPVSAAPQRNARLLQEAHKDERYRTDNQAGPAVTGSGKPPAAKILKDLLTQNYFVARTTTGEPFAVRYETPSVMIRVQGKEGLRQQLSLDYWHKTGEAPPSQALTDMVAMADAAGRSGMRQPVHLRVAEHDGMIYLDLGRKDGQAVEIGPGGWQLVDRCPVVFERTALTGELPLPQRPGSLDVARDLINVRGDSEWALYIACRIASLMPGITHPVELFTGNAGTAKTSVTRLTAAWIDPFGEPGMSVPVPRDGRHWTATAASTYVVPVDNVSSIPVWWSDLLCKAASGDGHIDRALYTDGEVYVSSFRDVVLLNGITLGNIRGDLADRSVAHVLARPDRYVSEDELAARWQQVHPQALAWLLDRVAEVRWDMLHAPAADSTDRLSTFMRVVAAVDARWRLNAMGAWRSGRLDVLEDVIEGDPVAVAIKASVVQPWMGTTSQLLSHLEMRGGLQPLARSDSWTPRMLGERIHRAQGALEALGWTISRRREGKDRTRFIEITPPGFGPAAYSNGHHAQRQSR